MADDSFVALSCLRRAQSRTYEVVLSVALVTYALLGILIWVAEFDRFANPVHRVTLRSKHTFLWHLWQHPPVYVEIHFEE